MSMNQTMQCCQHNNEDNIYDLIIKRRQGDVFAPLSQVKETQKGVGYVKNESVVYPSAFNRFIIL